MDNIKMLTCKTRTNDVDEEKGIVTVAVNGIGIKDSDGDISGKGSFNKTLKENFDRCKWFLNHDKTQLLGCPIEGKEESGNLIMVGKINLKKQIGAETFEDYKLYAECGKTLEHSVGVRAIKRDSVNNALVHEWFMGEYSTLTHWGANDRTFLVDLKQMSGDDLKGHVEFLKKAIGMKYSDERLKELDMNLGMIEKALSGRNIVACPHCGLAFDYDSVPEETLEDQVIEAVGDYTRWTSQDIVRDEMNKLRPEIQERVLNIINSKKGVDDFASNVRCPKCYTRIYKTSTKAEPLVSTLEDKSRKDCTLGLKDISGFL